MENLRTLGQPLLGENYNLVKSYFIEESCSILQCMVNIKSKLEQLINNNSAREVEKVIDIDIVKQVWCRMKTSL